MVPKSQIQANPFSQDKIIIEKEIMTYIESPFLMPIYFSFQNEQNLYLVMDFMYDFKKGLAEISSDICKKIYFWMKKKPSFI